jgi:spore germination cell wall hydrolase CwlJ-like protein
MTFDQNDINSAALCAWKEARGEGSAGMAAVLNVLKNRVGAIGFASNLHDVIYGKNQFTSMSVPTDPEFNLHPDVSDAQYDSAADLASLIFEPPAELGSVDNTNGAHYYANLHNVTSGWFYDNIVLKSDVHPIRAQIGHHTFFL